MYYKKFEELKVGDSCNDADCKFQAGVVCEIGRESFTVEWERTGVRYNKEHLRSVLDEGKLIAW